jgi:hypothetical protein
MTYGFIGGARGLKPCGPEVRQKLRDGDNMVNKKTYNQTYLPEEDTEAGIIRTPDINEDDLIRFLRGGLAAK